VKESIRGAWAISSESRQSLETTEKGEEKELGGKKRRGGLDNIRMKTQIFMGQRGCLIKGKIIGIRGKRIKDSR